MHSFLSSLCSALGTVVTLLLWGQLFAVDTVNENPENAGRSLGWADAVHPAPVVADPVRSAPFLQETQIPSSHPTRWPFTTVKTLGSEPEIRKDCPLHGLHLGWRKVDYRAASSLTFHGSLRAISEY